MKLLMDQSCTVVHHHHYHRTPTWNWRRKEKLKPFLVPTHRTRETTPAWVSYTLPRAEPLLSCYTLLSNLPHSSTCRLPEAFYCSVTWQQISVNQPLCTRVTQELQPALGVSGQAGLCFHHQHRLNGTNPQTLKTWEKLTTSVEGWQSLRGIEIPHLRCQTYPKRKGKGFFRTWTVGY